MIEIDERDLQHGFADMEQSVLDKQRETITALQTENEELEHIRKDLLTRNMNLVTELFSLQAQLAERDKAILEQQALVIEHQSVLDKLARLGNEPHFGDSTGNRIAQAALGMFAFSALEAHDRGVRINCLEDAKDICFLVAYGYECSEILRRRANELKEPKP